MKKLSFKKFVRAIKKFFSNGNVFYHPEWDMWFEGTLDEAVKLDIERQKS